MIIEIVVYGLLIGMVMFVILIRLSWMISLYNVKTTNTVVARNDSGPKNIVVEAGYYDQESLEEMFGSYLTFTEDGYPSSGPAYDLVFQQVPVLSRILRFDEIQASGLKGREPVDVSNGLNYIRIYSNLVKQYQYT